LIFEIQNQTAKKRGITIKLVISKRFVEKTGQYPVLVTKHFTILGLDILE